MLKPFFFGFFILLIAKISLAQSKDNDKFEWSAQYKFYFKSDSLQAQQKSEYMLLMFNQRISGFRSVSRFLLDSIRKTSNYKDRPQNERIAIGMKYPSNFEEYIVTDLNKEQVTVTTVANLSVPTSPQYTEIILPKWQIKNQTKRINNISCTRAETVLFGRKWIAWYANDYTFPFGPYKFYGLPGLIIEIADATGSYRYELVKFKKEQITYPRVPMDNVLKVSKAKCLELYRTGKYTTAMFKNVQIEGRGPEYFKRMQDGMDKKRMRDNNPIELLP